MGGSIHSTDRSECGPREPMIGRVSAPLDCHACAAPNPAEARFCSLCGAGLGGLCSGCGERLLVGALYCSSCGVPTERPDGGGATADPRSWPPPEERRTATILFADFAGFTALSEQADPELVKSIADRGLRRLGEEITGHGGHIDKFIGDNVMGVFGAPRAHDNDPERAVRAGLAMQRAMVEINAQEPALPDLSLRVGINTGEVLAGEVGDGYTVIGGPVNVAARLQKAAAIGSVIVGESTWRRTAGRIAYGEPRELALAGLSAPVLAYEAQDGPAPPRPAEGRGATPLVGRRTELELLRNAVTGSGAERRAQLVTILGPAGIGKSRLFAELAGTFGTGPDSPRVLRGHCPAYGARAAFWSFQEILRDCLGLPSGAGPQGDSAEWAALLIGIRALPGKPDAETAEVLAADLAPVLGIVGASPEPDRSSEDSARRRRDRFFGAVSTVLELLSGERTVVVAIEDLQWADDDALDLIEYLTRWCEGPIVVVCMAREELADRRSGWGGGRRRAMTIRLGPLPTADVRELAETLLESAPDPDLTRILVGRCAGNPLFAEEMASSIRERGKDAARLPETVQAVVDARLDSLSRPERRLIHHAAVAGQVFPESWLTGFAAAEGFDLARSLERLLELDLIAPAPSAESDDSRRFKFRHALIQEVAYSRLPKSERARKHLDAAIQVEDRGGSTAIVLAAEHLSAAARFGLEAGLGPGFLGPVQGQARGALEAAGDAAAAVHSSTVAIDHFEAALAAEGGSPEELARINEKLGDVLLRTARIDEAQASWNRSMKQLESLGDSAVDRARLHRKLAAAASQRGDREAALENLQAGINMLRDLSAPDVELVRLYGDAATLYMQSGENLLAIYAAEKSIRIAERLGEPAVTARALATFGRVFGRIGDNERARDNLERSVELARRSDEGELVRSLLLLGTHLEAAEEDLGRVADAYEEALEIAGRRGDLSAQAELQGGIARVALRRGDRERVAAATAAAEACGERAELGDLSCFGGLTRGWLQWCEDSPQAVSTLAAAAEGARRLGRMDIVFQALMLQGWVRSDQGRADEADRALTEALDVCERTGLLSQSIEATAARAVVSLRADQRDRARALASEAGAASERLSGAHSPAALEALGATDPDPDRGADLLAAAAAGWVEQERPLAAARAATLRATRLLEGGSPEAADAIREAAEQSERMGIEPLVRRARALTDVKSEARLE